MVNRRAWQGDEWQAFALQLVQCRHGSENVQTVPDLVGGDGGLEFFTTNGCLYQCYAPEETADVAKAASAMKAKATRDLPKLKKNKVKIENLLKGIPASRWILLCPFLDDKDVVRHVRAQGNLMKAEGLPFLDPGFEALCHSQDDFGGELAQLRAMSRGVPLLIPVPTADDVSAVSQTSVGKKIDDKLRRGFGLAFPQEDIEKRRNAYIKAHLYRENALAQLRQDHPLLWERAFSTLEAEETRLVAVGLSTASLPAELLGSSTDRLEKALAAELPTLAGGTVTQIAVGTVSEWLIRSPLDFP